MLHTVCITVCFVYMVVLCESTFFKRVQSTVLTEQNYHIIKSDNGITSTIMCAFQCMLLGDGCFAFSLTQEDTDCIIYSHLVVSADLSDLTNPTMYFSAPSFKWTVYVYIDTQKYAGSKDSLYMDVYGPKWKVSNILLGKYFDMGETYQRRFEGYSGHVEYIRLYQEGVDGMRIVKVTMEDIYGCVYTFVCNCWIQTDQPEDDSKASWILQPEMV